MPYHEGRSFEEMRGRCYSCGAQIPDGAYCEPCVEGQLVRQRKELAAFDAFHRFADAVPLFNPPHVMRGQINLDTDNA